MIHATPTSTNAGGRGDPSVAMLVPTPTKWRNRFLAVAGVVVIAAAIASPMILRPSITQPNGGSAGTWRVFASRHQVVTITTIESQNWPGVELREVPDLSGADVAHAWVVDSTGLDVVEALLDGTVDISGSDLPAELVASGAQPLPHRLDRGDSAALVIMWDIVDCDELDAGEPAGVEVRTLPGTNRIDPLPEVSAPAYDIDTLRGTVACD